jgi:hypothetical protein
MSPNKSYQKESKESTSDRISVGLASRRSVGHTLGYHAQAAPNGTNVNFLRLALLLGPVQQEQAKRVWRIPKVDTADRLLGLEVALERRPGPGFMGERQNIEAHLQIRQVVATLFEQAYLG